MGDAKQRQGFFPEMEVIGQAPERQGQSKNEHGKHVPEEGNGAITAGTPRSAPKPKEFPVHGAVHRTTEGARHILSLDQRSVAPLADEERFGQTLPQSDLVEDQGRIKNPVKQQGVGKLPALELFTSTMRALVGYWIIHDGDDWGRRGDLGMGEGQPLVCRIYKTSEKKQGPRLRCRRTLGFCGATGPPSAPPRLRVKPLSQAVFRSRLRRKTNRMRRRVWWWKFWTSSIGTRAAQVGHPEGGSGARVSRSLCGGGKRAD